MESRGAALLGIAIGISIIFVSIVPLVQALCVRVRDFFQAIHKGRADRRRFYPFVPGCFVVCVSSILLFSGRIEANTSEPLIMGPPGVIWESSLDGMNTYEGAVSVLFSAFEGATGSLLVPGNRGKVGLKVNTRSGRGLSTPLPLLRAVISALQARGFSRSSILLVDNSVHTLYRSGVLSFGNEASDHFEGCPVLALDTGQYFNEDWFYDSPLPPVRRENSDLFTEGSFLPQSLKEGDRQRKSFLPMPLILEVDFWINLATVADDPALGIDGAMASATLWNVGNSQRFLANEATGSAAMAEIAAIPELRERLILHCVSLERYQYIGGPMFHSRYCLSEPKLWIGSDALAIDRLLLERINRQRVLEGFPQLRPLPRQFPFAASLGLGVYNLEAIEIRTIPANRAPKFEMVPMKQSPAVGREE